MLRNWLLAIRPKTLIAGLSPIAIAITLAYPNIDLTTNITIIITALLIQITTNLANDYYDYKKGADTHERKGPKRASQSGLIPPKTIKKAFILTSILALIGGLILTTTGGIPILIVGLTSILFAILYTAGPYPIAYLGLGDLFVLLFFGPIAIGGTYYLNTQTLPLNILITGLSPALLSVAILAVNNLRDVNEDKKANKNTLAVRFGKTFVKTEYTLAIVLASTLPYFQYKYNLPLATIILGYPLIKNIWAEENLNKGLEKTGKLLTIFTILFIINHIIGGY